MTLAGASTGAEAASHPFGTRVLRAADLRTSIRPTVAEIDLDALRGNVARIRQLLGPKVALYGVIKADAYGHGAVRVARVLGPLCDGLAVSLAEEGLELRGAGVDTPVLVLGAYYGGQHSEVIEAGLTPVIYEAGDLERFAHAPAQRARGVRRLPGKPLEFHLKVDTGMSRLGVSVGEIERVLARLRALPGLRLSGLCTHVACGELPDPAPTVAQLNRFEAVLAAVRAQGVFPGVVHAANSATAARFPSARYDAVRPGLLLYGALPSEAVRVDGLVPVMSLHTRVMAIHDIEAGTGVSYGARFIAQRPSRIATLPLGYADGYPRHVAGAEVLIRGQRAKIAGAVCMDLMMVDVTDVAGAEVGDRVTLFGRQEGRTISVDEVAGWAGTVHYEILCGISKRVPRVYLEAGREASE